MDIKTTDKGTGFAQIEVNNIKRLAVTSNLTSKIYKQISVQDLLSEPGIIIKDAFSKKWECTESFEYEGKLIFPGPFYDGTTLADTVMDIDTILKLAKALQKTMQGNSPLKGYYPPGIFSTSGGDILFFPPQLINYVVNQLSDEANLKYWQPYNHPDAHGEQEYSFILAVLTYKLLTGSMPYTGSTITEIREKMRNSRPVKIELLAPGIKDGIAELINGSLNLKDIKLFDWIEQLGLWKEEGAQNTLDEKNLLVLQKTAEKKRKKRDNDFIRSQFFSHNWKTIGIILIVFTVLILFSLGPIKNARKPPATLNMDAIEVVNFYYQSYSDMNVEDMEDCLKKGVGKKDTNEITQMYVISKVRTGYEGKSGFVSAQDWSDGLITKLNEGENIAGIANLQITYLGDSTFQANYVRWFPETLSENNSTKILKPKKVIYTDTLTLDKIKDVWTIVKLDRKTKAGHQ
ncbi:MAG: hypothetical protein J7L71_06915 [Spirochaetaceae bacterium]|nr:hypothetical protein [Spirochaetaceae bacterium]